MLLLLVLVKEFLLLSLLERIKTKVEKLMMTMTTTAGTCDGRRRQMRSGAPSSFRILLLLPLLQTVGRPLQTRPANFVSTKGRERERRC